MSLQKLIVDEYAKIIQAEENYMTFNKEVKVKVELDPFYKPKQDTAIKCPAPSTSAGPGGYKIIQILKQNLFREPSSFKNIVYYPLSMIIHMRDIVETSIHMYVCPYLPLHNSEHLMLQHCNRSPQ